MFKEPTDQKKQYTLESFREEIKKLSDEEVESVHLKGIKPDELGENDKEFYQRFVNDEISFEEFKEKQNHMMVNASQYNESQKLLMGYMGNEYMRKLSRDLLK